MQIFDPKALSNAADAAKSCQMMGFSYAENDLNRNDHLNLNFE